MTWRSNGWVLSEPRVKRKLRKQIFFHILEAERGREEAVNQIAKGHFKPSHHRRMFFLFRLFRDIPFFLLTNVPFIPPTFNSPPKSQQRRATTGITSLREPVQKLVPFYICLVTWQWRCPFCHLRFPSVLFFPLLILTKL